MEFEGFPRDGLAFLGELKANNRRDWFEANRRRYEDAIKAPIAALCVTLAEMADAAGLDITADPKRSAFRIHRDVRFSKDKSPYKTHVGMHFTPSGQRLDPGGVYCHVDPAESFLATGLYDPETKVLTKVRDWIVAHFDRFEAMRDDLAEQGLTLKAWNELKRLPPAFKDHAESAAAPYLKWKNMLVTRPLDAATITSPALVTEIARFADETADFRRWCREVRL
ncbi:MAG: DUF2461 domain-containing protein [Azospirillaceae bacterium]